LFTTPGNVLDLTLTRAGNPRIHGADVFIGSFLCVAGSCALQGLPANLLIFRLRGQTCF